MARRKLQFETIDQVIADIEHLHRVGYTREGNWGLTEICEHCAGFADMSIHGFPEKMPWLVRATVGRWIFHFLLRRGRIPKGVPAPKFLRPKKPAPQQSREKSASEEKQAVERFVALLRRVQKTEKFATHPFAGDLGSDPWRKIQVIHTAHHLSFLVPKEPAPIKLQP